MKKPLIHGPAGALSRKFSVSADLRADLRAGPVDNVSVLVSAAHASGEEQELDVEVAYLAQELVAMQEGLSPRQTRAMFLFVLVSLWNLREGSTRMPLDPGPTGFLAGHLTELIPRRLAAMDPAWNPETLLGVIGEILAQGKAADIIGSAGEFKPLIIEGPYLYHQRMLHYEQRLVEALKARLEGPCSKVSAAAVAAGLGEILDNPTRLKDGGPMRLSAEQQYSMLTAIHSPLTIVTGGPGTGKTSIVVSILRLITRLGVPADAIALAAPTGKAAHRLGESIHRQLNTLARAEGADLELMSALDKPRTLHRLLGYSPTRRGFYHHENNRLSQQLVIVDEASMIDVFMMERLIRAVRAGAHLVLLGDAEQLPSVDTGAVLRDLVPAQTSTRTPWRRHVPELPVSDSPEPTARFAVRLHESYRMDPKQVSGRKILQFAHHINRAYSAESERSAARLLELKDDLDASPLLRRRPDFDALAYEGVELIEAPRGYDDAYGALLSAFVDHWFAAKICALPDFDELTRARYELAGSEFDAVARARLKTLFAHFEEFRVLTLTRVFPTGAVRLNAAFHTRFLLRHEQTTRWDFVAGEPVIMLRNDYGRGLFNGDQGIILWVRRTGRDKPELMAVFERGDDFIPFHLGAIRPHIEHACAMTVHKSQGSEFKHVALILSHQDMPLLTREILYTGITRASESVTVVGQSALLEIGARRSVQRFSGIAEKLPGVRVVEVVEAVEAAETVVVEAEKPAEEPVAAKKASAPVQGRLFAFDD